MAKYKNNNFDKYKQRKKRTYHSIHRDTLFIFGISSCLVAILLTACQFKVAHQSNEPYYFSDTSTNISEKDSVNTSSSMEEINTDETSWCLILTNRWNPIPDNYKIELTKLSNGSLIDTRIYPALQKMFDSAREDDIYPIVASGYRTTEKQQNLMDEKINEYLNEGYSRDEATLKAEAWVAIPGTSEHQLGIAVDINADRDHSTGDEVYEWLAENAYKYGFIKRYPSDKTYITGVINEPWHYRYVGVTTATEIKNQDICLEEYLNANN